LGHVKKFPKKLFRANLILENTLIRFPHHHSKYGFINRL
jgi:hypothetical protein